MELLADRDPEDARRLLDAVLERMMEAVHRYEGTVNQVLGDGIMALFGAPLAHENHAVRACYAALRMQEDIGRYGDEMQRALGVPIQIRVGLNSGEVVVGSIGSDLRMEYSAVGQTTHLAARMEQMAKPALRASHGRHPAAGRGIRPGQGARRGAGARAGGPGGGVRAGRGHGGADTPSGRGRAGAHAARRAPGGVGPAAPGGGAGRNGRGQVVALVGEAGVGSRAWPGRSPAPTGPATGWSSRAASASHGKGTSWLPVIDLLRAYFRIDDGDDARTVREKLIGGSSRSTKPCGQLSPAFEALLEIPVEDSGVGSAGRDERASDGQSRP